MAIPVADFSFTIDGLKVTFEDNSSNTPLYWAWVFGDGETGTDENPIHNYMGSGAFSVTLIAGNNDGLGNVTKIVDIALPGTADYLTIDNYIQYKIPASVYLGINTNLPTYISDMKRKWQLYLQKLVNPKISNNDVFTETAWNGLQRSLIGELVILDVLAGEGLGTLWASGQFGSEVPRDLKKLETGPSNAEWWGIYHSWNKPGAVELSKQLCCTIARNLGVRLPWCNYNINTPQPFVKSKMDNPPIDPSLYLRKNYNS